MKFFVDTADTTAIRDLHDLGVVDGVTTNPSLVMKSGRDFKEVVAEICEMVAGPVSAETVATDAEGMIAEGRELAKIAENIAIKVPLTWEGLKACKTLSDEGRMVNVTLCFSANHANYSGRRKAGSSFIFALHTAARQSSKPDAGTDREHTAKKVPMKTNLFELL